MAKRVLITGMTGMAGSHLADLLVAEEPDCLIFGTKRWRSSSANVAQVQDKIELIDCDLTDPSGTLELVDTVRPDYIFHLAAQSFVRDSWHCPHTTVINNIQMQLNLFEAVRRCGLDPVVQIAGSSEQYGKVQTDAVALNEDYPFRPLSPYAVSKVTQDMLAYQYHQSYGLKAIRTRAFNHTGPRRASVFATSNFAMQIAEIELGLKPPVVSVGNLDAKRDFSDVRDVVRAYWLAVQYGKPGDDYVIATGTARSIREMLDCLLGLSKHKIEVRFDPSRQRPSDVLMLRGDSTKFRLLTGWEPRYSFEQTMSDLLDWWRGRLSRTTGKVIV